MAKYIVTEEQAQFIAKHVGIFTGREMVECKDCEFALRSQGNDEEAYCFKHGNWFKINGYCHLGRKKKDEADRRR